MDLCEHVCDNDNDTLWYKCIYIYDGVFYDVNYVFYYYFITELGECDSNSRKKLRISEIEAVHLQEKNLDIHKFSDILRKS